MHSMITVSRCAIFRSPLVEWAGLDWAARMGVGEEGGSLPASPFLAGCLKRQAERVVICLPLPGALRLETFCKWGEGAEEALVLTGRESRMGREPDSLPLTARFRPGDEERWEPEHHAP